MKASPILNAFNAGELSPLIDGRTDLAKYFSGAKLVRNFLGTVQGPVVRRGGTRFVSAIKTEANRAWLIKFEFSATQCFYLEFGGSYVRFYTNHGQLLVSGVAAYSGATNYVLGDLVVQGGINYYCILATVGNAPPNATYWYPLTGAIYEVPSPYALADLTNADGSCALQIEQSGDVLYIANSKRTYAPRTLTRYANTNWRFATFAPIDGPFLENNTSATRLSVSTNTGGTLLASAATFVPTDVGRLVRLEADSFDTRPWETAKAYAVNDRVRSDGKTYVAMTAATSGTSPPVHQRGTAYDGLTGVKWLYENAGYGVALITAYTDSTHVTCAVSLDSDIGLYNFPGEVVTVSGSTARWALGAWSATTEYPASVAFFRSRLFWAGRQRLWGSVPDDYTSYTPDFFNEVRADSAIARILSAREVNDILWMIGADKLVLGTSGGEFVAGEISTADPLGPANFEIKRQSTRRARAVRPITAGTSEIYVQRGGRKLMSLNYALESDKYASIDLAVLADRITRTGVAAMTYQAEPHSTIWVALVNGTLLGFTYDLDQQVTGWHPHALGGTSVVVESVAAGPSPDGTREELWMIVSRTINGSTHRYVEFMERSWEGPDEDGVGGDSQANAYYVDCGLSYSGAAATVMSGLSHLEGQSVQILADGATHPNKTVSGGSVTLDRSASVVHIGLPFVSRLVPMRFEAGGGSGSSQGKIRRIHKLVIRFLDTLGGKAGKYKGKLDELSRRAPGTPMGQPSPIFSNDHEMEFPGDYDFDSFVEIRQDQPLPMTISAIMPRMVASDP